MDDKNLLMLICNYPDTTVVGELARDLFATRVVARSAVHISHPMASDASIAAVVTDAVRELRATERFEECLQMVPTEGGVS